MSPLSARPHAKVTPVGHNGRPAAEQCSRAAGIGRLQTRR